MMQNYQKFTLDKNFKFLCIFEGVIMEKLKGGPLTRLKFWSPAIVTIVTKKSKIATLSVQPFMVKMGQSLKNGIFCNFFAIFAKGILAKLNELESESDQMNGEVDSLVNFPIDTSLKTIAHSALSDQNRIFLRFVQTGCKREY